MRTTRCKFVNLMTSMQKRIGSHIARAWLLLPASLSDQMVKTILVSHLRSVLSKSTTKSGHQEAPQTSMKLKLVIAHVKILIGAMAAIIAKPYSTQQRRRLRTWQITGKTWFAQKTPMNGTVVEISTQLSQKTSWSFFRRAIKRWRLKLKPVSYARPKLK